MKKVISILLILVMLVGLGAPAMAVEVEDEALSVGMIATAAPQREQIEGWRYVNVSATSALNLRESTSTNSRVVTTLPRGAALWVSYAITVNGIRWARVNPHFAVVGYVDTQHLRVGSPFGAGEPIMAMRSINREITNIYAGPGRSVIATVRRDHPIWVNYVILADGIRWASVGANDGYINSMHLR